MSTTIKIRNLNQYYGKKQALNDINLTIQTGMFGLLGRNGAGKTTLMKVIATLLPQTEGEVSVCGRSAQKPQEVRKIVGYLPQDFSMYGNMGAYEALDYLAVMFSGRAGDMSAMSIVGPWIGMAVLGVLGSTPLAKKVWEKGKDAKLMPLLEAVLCLAALVLCTASLVSDSYNPFLYFRF